jgi:II/X family phage/plasmid replication protein
VLAELDSSSCLYLHGNPSKFLQGHNIFGSDDLLSLVYDTYRKVCDALSLRPQLAELGTVREGRYDLSRTDINYSFGYLTALTSWHGCEPRSSSPRPGMVDPP